jgi:hypothetical protein
VPGHFHVQHQADQEVADDHDGDVWREVIGAVMRQFFAANLASVDNLQVRAKHAAFTAIRTFAQCPAPHGLASAALFTDFDLHAHPVTSFSGPLGRNF